MGLPYQILKELRQRLRRDIHSMDFGGEWKERLRQSLSIQILENPKVRRGHRSGDLRGIILGCSVALFRSGRMERLDPESCDVINGSEAVFGVFFDDLVAPHQCD
jgi:hypothetical protein